MKKERQTERRKMEDEKKRTARKEVFSWVRMFAIVIIVVFVLTQFIIINAKIPSGSMENTIMTHDRLIGFRFAYWFDEPQRGDIILFEYPVDEKQIYIKRVIGLPGETVEIRDGKVYIDDSDTPLDEPYVKGVPTGDYGPYVVPEGCYFMMGDNRNDSLDSRFWNNTYVKENKIIAKALFRYFPKPGKIE